jgi:hypothetical protein
MGKNIFPNLETYLYADEKIKQTTLFYMLAFPIPYPYLLSPPPHEILTISHTPSSESCPDPPPGEGGFI